jgi:hypothetical protein
MESQTTQRYLARAVRHALKRTARVTVVQRTKQYDYELPFLREVVKRILDKIPGASQLKLRVEFRSRVRGEGTKHNYGLHEHLKNGTRILINNTVSLSLMCETLAHEIGHAMQHQNGDLPAASLDSAEQNGVWGTMWRGEFIPEKTPQNQRPWEKDAKRYERYGAAVYQELKAGGDIPKTRGEQVEEDFYTRNPEFRPTGYAALTIGELNKLPPEERAKAIAWARNR